MKALVSIKYNESRSIMNWKHSKARRGRYLAKLDTV